MTRPPGLAEFDAWRGKEEEGKGGGREMERRGERRERDECIWVDEQEKERRSINKIR